MSMILEQINSVGYRFVEFALPMMVQSALLIAVLLLADLLLRKKVRAVVRYWLWMLVLLKLVLPTTLHSPFSLSAWFGDKLASVKVSDTNTTAQPTNLPQTTVMETISETDAPSAATIKKILPSVTEPTVTKTATLPATSPVTLTWRGIVFLVWIAVVAAMGLLLLQRAIFVSALVAQAKNPTEMMKDTFKFCCGQMGLKNKVGLKVSANTASPAVCGLFRPMILVPENLAPTLGSGHLRTVLLHELAHVKRGDLWINMAQTILQIIYFYNPLLWLANFVIRRIREQAVDETVQVAMGAKAGQYPQTLIDVAKIAFNRPTLSLRLIGVVESKNALKSRIKRILDRPTPKSAKLGILSLVTLVIIGCTLLPMAKADKSKRVSQNPIGKWQSVDFVQKIEDFKPGEKTWQGKLYLPEVDFMKNGKTSSSFTWKKNQIYNEDGRTKAIYQIKEMNGSRYLFLPWLSGDVTERGEKPWYYVMKEVRDDKKNKSGELSKAVIVKEGVGFDDIIIGDINCTGEFIKSKLGKPSKEIKYETGRHLDYGKTYGLGFWINKKDNVLKEIRLNKEFTGKLTSGISMSSTKEDVFDVYGQPIREEVVENFGQRSDNNVLLFKKPFSGIKSNIAKIYYDEHGLLFWFNRDNINQIVTFKKESNQQGKEEKFKATLDNGVTVELFGVCEYPSEGKQWWQPDGSALEKPPSYVSRQGKPIVNSNEEFNRLIEIAVGLSGAHLQDVSLHCEVPGATRTSVGDVTGLETEKLKSIACEVSKLFSSVQANVGVAAGSWETIGVQKADIEEIVEEKVNGGFITWDVPFEKQSKIRKRTGRRVVDTTIKVAHSFGDYDFRVIAKDRYGNIHKAPLSSGGGADALSTNEYRFPIHLAQIEEFQFQIRPYQWVTFNNVSLKPGHKTNLQVDVKENSEVSDTALPVELKEQDDCALEIAQIEARLEKYASGEKSFPKNLNEEQKLYMEWTQERFGPDPIKSEYTKLSESAKEELEEIWIEILSRPECREYYSAIDGLAAINSRRAVEPLLKVAAERIEKDNRYRWQAARALGIVGDDSVIPELIHLVYHYNQNTRFWAQISLVRLTGENFGADWQKWADWWNSQKGKPRCSTEKVEWTSNADWADPEKQKEMDEEFIEQLREEKKGETDKSSVDVDRAGQKPMVVRTSPTVYADDVSPELREITVTFDQLMRDKSWSWTGNEMFPKMTGQPSYDKDKMTCSLPVKLEPGKVYRVGINSLSYQGFKSADGVPAKQYVILFATRGNNGKPTPIPGELITTAKRINGPIEIPYTQIMYGDIQPDGTILFKNTIRQVNQSSREITSTRFINSDFVHVTSMSDDEGKPLKFTSTHEDDIYRYEVIFNEPILPGKVMEYTSKGTMEGLVKPVFGGKDTFQYYMRHWPAAGQPTLRMETYLLPASAELISTTPEDMQRQTKDGRIELHVEKTIPPSGSITTAFQYQLHDGKDPN